MLKLLPSILFTVISFLGISQVPVKASPLNVGETLEWESSVLGEKRVLNVYLPLSYSWDTAKVYPVIYLLDGSMDEDFVHISGLVQFGSYSWVNMLPESIVVGIANIDRRRDFTFPSGNKQDVKNNPTSGHSENFIEFIENELIGIVNDRYRTTQEKTIIGQSLGGLLATEILFKKPDMFDNYIIISPSLWWNDESLLSYTASSTDLKKSVYIGVGKEGEMMERPAKELHTKLDESLNERSQLIFTYFEKYDHSNILHVAVYDAFEKLFKPETKR